MDFEPVFESAEVLNTEIQAQILICGTVVLVSFVTAAQSGMDKRRLSL